MAEPPPEAQKSFVEGQSEGDLVGPLTGESPAAAAQHRAALSPDVQAALAIGTAPVSAVALIELLLAQLDSDYLEDRRSLVPAWPEQGIRQPPTRWEADLRRVLSTEHEISGGGAILALCLLDPQLSAVSQASGLLGSIAEETTPTVSEYLSGYGRSLLRRRAPLVALATQELPPDVEHRFEAGRVETLSIARQTGQASGVVGRWAAVVGGEVWAGATASVRKVAFPEPVALGWRDDLLVAFCVVDGQGYFWEDGSPPRGNVTDVPGRTGSVAVIGDGADALIDDDGRLFAGPGYVQLVGGANPRDDLYRGYVKLAAVRDGLMPRIAAVNDTGVLHVYAGEQVDAPSLVHAPPVAQVAANADYLYLNGPNGELTGHAWAEGQSTTSLPTYELARQVTSPFDHWAAGGRLLVASFSSTVYVYDGTQHVATRNFDDLVTAVGVSPDGKAIGVATGDGVVRLWRVDLPSELLLTSYTNDAATGDDLLGIAPAVDALATLMCAKQVLPPLSIGLFGAWGSGKSFFMEKLAERVTTITDDARASDAPQHALWTWRNVRQIRFNAWHYSGADVWAGLLDQLLRDLAATPLTKLPKELDALQRERLTLLSDAEQGLKTAENDLVTASEKLTTATTTESAAQSALEAAEKSLTTARVSAANQALGEEVRSSARGALDSVGLQYTATTAVETLSQLAEARQRVDAVRELVEGPHRVRLLLTLLAGPAAAILLAALVWLLRPQLSGVAAAVGAVTAALVAVNSLLRRGISAVDGKLTLIADAEEKARAEVEESRRKVTQAKIARAEALEAAEKAERDAEQARVATAEAEERVRNASTGSLLEEYLTKRSGSADYRSQLGIIGTVRADLQVISDSVDQHNANIDRPGVDTVDDVVNRVILYVDDLDRCPPKVVVKVLEAVHLLLSYPLFVVVVAVDAHWVSRSLATVYPTMLSDGEVTPDSYLEKIFQLPVWLDSPDGSAAGDMLRALFDPELGPAPERQEPAADTPAAATSESTEADPSSSGPPRPGAATPSGGLATIMPRALQEVAGEVDAVAGLAPLLSRSPRALKRFLNTYRLLKVVVTESDELARARLLLAIATGRPDLGERLLNQILARKETTDTIRDLMTGWRNDDREWLTAQAPDEPDWAAYSCASTAAAAAEVRRFVYRTSVPAERGRKKNAGRP